LLQGRALRRIEAREENGANEKMRVELIRRARIVSEWLFVSPRMKLLRKLNVVKVNGNSNGSGVLA